MTLLAVFCLRKRREDDFDGNFDPAHVKLKGGGSGILPKFDLEDGLTSDNEVEIDEDDGMGGRLGAGPGCGGTITPYFFQPAPLSGTAAFQVSGHWQQHQNQLQIQQMSNNGAAADGVATALPAGYPNGKRAIRQQYAQQSPNQTISSGSFYPSSSNPNLHLNSNSVSPESYSILTNDGSPSLGGSGSGGIYYQSMGRGPSPGPLLTPSTGGRNAKEMKAIGRVISNPDDGRGQLPAFQQAYLPTASGPRQQQHCLSFPSPTANLSQPPFPSRAGTAVVVHEDGRVVYVRPRQEERISEGEVLNVER